MLYISKRLGRNKFIIIDTDDNTQETVSWSQLTEIARLGIQIEGVTTTTRIVDGEPVMYLVDAAVYQPPSSMTTKQIKLKTLGGVDIKTFGKEIVSVSWRDDAVRTGTRVRLSDYGTKCSDKILGQMISGQKSQITLVLDDKVRIHKSTFMYAADTKVVLDVSEVTDIRILKWVYQEWLDNGQLVDIADLIIDKPSRLEKWAGVGVVLHGVNKANRVFSTEARDFVENRFFPNFDTFSRSKFNFVNYTNARTMAKEYIRRLRDKEWFWRSNSEDYEMVRIYDGSDVFHVLGQTTTLNPQTAGQFLAYLGFFEPTDRVKEAYVRLVNRANNWYLDLAKEMHWRISMA